MKTTVAMVLMTALITGCGSSESTEKEKIPSDKADGDNAPAASSSDMVDDTEISGQLVSAQVDEAIAGTVEEQDSEAGLSLAEVDAEGSAKRHRVCTVDGATAVVDIQRNASRHLSFDLPMRSGTTDFSSYEEKKRVWSREGGEIGCHAGGKFAAVPFADMQGVALSVTFKHERSRASSFENKKSGKSWSRSFKHAAEGSRQVKWTSVTNEGGKLLLQKEISSTATRKLEVTNKDGEQRSLEGTIATGENAPLVILVERAADTLAATSRTIKSGTLIGTGKDGGRVETTFDNVVYDRTKGCVASSGKISGAVYAKDATEPSKTFEITFDGETKTITYSTGESFEYAPEGCDLDDPETVVEADAAADVTQPE